MAGQPTGQVEHHVVPLAAVRAARHECHPWCIPIRGGALDKAKAELVIHVSTRCNTEAIQVTMQVLSIGERLQPFERRYGLDVREPLRRQP